MTSRRPRASTRPAVEAATLPLPPGTPSWITWSLIQQTLEVWQSRYSQPLTTADAISILTGGGRLMRVLIDESQDSRDAEDKQVGDPKPRD